jgi:hypothetical protein
MIIDATAGLLRANRNALRRTGKRPGRLAHIGMTAPISGIMSVQLLSLGIERRLVAPAGRVQSKC